MEQDTLTVKEIIHHIEKLPKGKAPGPDFLTLTPDMQWSYSY